MDTTVEQEKNEPLTDYQFTGMILHYLFKSKELMQEYCQKFNEKADINDLKNRVNGKKFFNCDENVTKRCTKYYSDPELDGTSFKLPNITKDQISSLFQEIAGFACSAREINLIRKEEILPEKNSPDLKRPNQEDVMEELQLSIEGLDNLYRGSLKIMRELGTRSEADFKPRPLLMGNGDNLSKLLTQSIMKKQWYSEDDPLDAGKYIKGRTAAKLQFQNGRDETNSASTPEIPTAS